MWERVRRRKWLLLGLAGAATASTCLVCIVVAAVTNPNPRASRDGQEDDEPTIKTAEAPATSDAATTSEHAAAPLDAGGGDAPDQAEEPSAGWAPPDHKFRHLGECPEGLWALVPGYTPGDDEFEQREAEASRKELATALEGDTFVVSRLSADLGDYSFSRKAFPVETQGLAHCDHRSVYVALTNPRIGSWADSGRQWEAKPFRVWVPMPEDEAREFKKGTKGFFSRALVAEVAFKVERARLDRKIVRDAMGKSDVGAGALIQARRLGVRIVQGDDVIHADGIAEDPRTPRSKSTSKYPCLDRCKARHQACGRRCRNRFKDRGEHEEVMACHRKCEKTWMACNDECKD